MLHYGYLLLYTLTPSKNDNPFNPIEALETQSTLEFGHQTIKNWLVSRPVVSRLSDSIGLALGDRTTITRNVRSGPYRLQAGEEVRIDKFDPAANTAWVSCFNTFHRSIDVPLDALKPAK